jgi:AcrR family transcriptional regulator
VIEKAAAGRQQERREALVIAAYDLIAASGFEGLRTRDVAGRAGVNIATLHYYFPTKEDLIGAVVAHALQRFRSTLQPRDSAAEQLRDHFRALRRLLSREPQLAAVMGELALRSSRDRALAQMLKEAYDVWHKTVRGLLRRGVERGSLDSRLDTDGVAALVVATLTAITLPTVAAHPERVDQAIRQLERLLAPPASA